MSIININMLLSIAFSLYFYDSFMITTRQQLAICFILTMYVHVHVSSLLCAA